jgi:hypothetical protein
VAPLQYESEHLQATVSPSPQHQQRRLDESSLVSPPPDESFMDGGSRYHSPGQQQKSPVGNNHAEISPITRNADGSPHELSRYSSSAAEQLLNSTPKHTSTGGAATAAALSIERAALFQPATKPQEQQAGSLLGVSAPAPLDSGVHVRSAALIGGLAARAARHHSRVASTQAWQPRGENRGLPPPLPSPTTRSSLLSGQASRKRGDDGLSSLARTQAVQGSTIRRRSSQTSGNDLLAGAEAVRFCSLR